jgi:hypothetical protein
MKHLELPKDQKSSRNLEVLKTDSNLAVRSYVRNTATKFGDQYTKERETR